MDLAKPKVLYSVGKATYNTVNLDVEGKPAEQISMCISGPKITEDASSILLFLYHIYIVGLGQTLAFLNILLQKSISTSTILNSLAIIPFLAVFLSFSSRKLCPLEVKTLVTY